jgi:putative ABC transport system permease protein
VPDYLLNAVRSLPGVRYAVPLYSGGALVKLRSGAYQAVSVIGLDDSSLFGRPILEKGNIQDIYAENGFIVVHDAEYRKLENPGLGTEFELNDHRGVVVGIARWRPAVCSACRPVHTYTLSSTSTTRLHPCWWK